MGFIGGLYDILKDQAVVNQANATAADTYALSQQRMANVAMQNINMQKYMNTNAALQQYLSGWTPDPSLNPSPDDTPMQAARKNAARMQQDAQFARGAAQAIARGGGDTATIQKFMQDAIQTQHWAAYAGREALQEQKDQATTLSNIASGVNDDASAAAAYQQIARLDSQMARSLNVDRDINGGVVYGPNTATTFDAIAGSGITAAKKADLQLRAAQAQDRQQQIAQRAAESQALTSERNAQAAAAQSRADYYKAQTEDIQAGRPRAAKAGAAARPLGPATAAERDSAREAILADENFGGEGVKFDRTLNAFASDVADRAKKIARDTGMGADEAREQAINELRGYVRDKPGSTTNAVTLGFFGQGPQKTYVKGAKGPISTPPAKGQAPQAALDYLTAHPETKDAFKAKYGYLP
jgi:hypothetical protein